MVTTIAVESTLTDRYQTTVPETVRRALQLGKRDKLHYDVRPGGEVVLTKAEAPVSDDPALGAFLHFLAADMASHPERLKAIDSPMAQRLQALAAGVAKIDLNAALSPEDD